MATETAIFQAVAPLKGAAQDHAADIARDIVDKAIATLEAAGWNLDTVAPYPNSRTDNKATYRGKLARRGFFQALTTRDPKRTTTRMGDPHYVIRDTDREAKHIEREREAAGFAFDAFVAKLESKVGVHTAAAIDGRPWLGSIVIATKADGTVERWSTQQIINRSVLGKLFHQWPTRKMKG